MNVSKGKDLADSLNEAVLADDKYFTGNRVSSVFDMRAFQKIMIDVSSKSFIHQYRRQG